MARTRTLLEMRTEARALADQVDSIFVTDAQANVWINQAIAELWSMLTVADPQRYMLTDAVTTVPGQREYGLPTDFMALIGVDWVSGNERYPMEPFSLNDRYVGPFGGLGWFDAGGSVPSARYALRGSRLVFDRDPPAGSVRVLYVQAPQPLAVDASTFDGVAGWEEWVVLECAIRMMAKEESDPSIYMAQQQRIEARIKSLAGKRDIGRARQIPRYSEGRGRRGLFYRR